MLAALVEAEQPIKALQWNRFNAAMLSLHSMFDDKLVNVFKYSSRLQNSSTEHMEILPYNCYATLSCLQ